MNETTCRICDLTNFLNGGDLDPTLHQGFTIGKKGKTMYWFIVWWKSGNCTIFQSKNGTWPKPLKGDQEITIHFKPKSDKP